MFPHSLSSYHPSLHPSLHPPLTYPHLLSLFPPPLPPPSLLPTSFHPPSLPSLPPPSLPPPSLPPPSFPSLFPQRPSPPPFSPPPSLHRPSHPLSSHPSLLLPSPLLPPHSLSFRFPTQCRPVSTQLRDCPPRFPSPCSRWNVPNTSGTNPSVPGSKTLPALPVLSRRPPFSPPFPPDCPACSSTYHPRSRCRWNSPRTYNANSSAPTRTFGPKTSDLPCPSRCPGSKRCRCYRPGSKTSRSGPGANSSPNGSKTGLSGSDPRASLSGSDPRASLSSSDPGASLSGSDPKASRSGSDLLVDRVRLPAVLAEGL